MSADAGGPAERRPLTLSKRQTQLVIAALVGLVAGALLTAWKYPRGPIDWNDPAVMEAFSFLSFASLPAGAFLFWIYPEDWERHIQAVMLVGPALNGAVMGAALLLLAQRLRASRLLRTAAASAIAMEVPLILLLHHIGIPSPFAGPNLPGTLVEVAHFPGIALLSLLGLCCGYVSHLVISDFWGGPVQHPSAVGLALLFASNVVMLTAILRGLFALGSRARGLRRKSASPQPAARAAADG